MTTTSPRPDLAALTERFLAVRARTDRLTRDLGPEDQTPQSMTEASPAKWHRAHTTWFFEEFVLGRVPGYVAPEPVFRFLFNSYYEAVGPRQPRPERGLITRPSVAEISDFRARVDEAVVAALEADDIDERGLELLDGDLVVLVGAREDLVQRLTALAEDVDAPALVLVTHHVEEIPPGFTDILMLREGRVVAAGPIESTLTAENLSATFGLPLSLERSGNRWFARARTAD